jgi:hypothetical protein
MKRKLLSRHHDMEMFRATGAMPHAILFSAVNESDGHSSTYSVQELPRPSEQ